MRFAFLILFFSASLFSSAQFCNNQKRITPQNYLFEYYGIRNAIFKKTKSSSTDIIEALTKCDSPEHADDELCKHNHFLFIDFILYFDLEEKYRRNSGYTKAEFSEALLELRDMLYQHWMDGMVYQVPNGYHEWESVSVKGESFKAFKSRGSEKFSLLETMVKRLNPKPRQKNTARWFVHHHLDASTPFSSIMTNQAMHLISTNHGRQHIERFSSELDNSSEHDNLWNLTLSSVQNDTLSALAILSSVSAQRMYLIRDYKHWLEENLSQDEYELQMLALMQSSIAYFKIETVAHSLGEGWNYPEGVEALSAKSYHFYTTAMLAYQLAQRGYDKETAVKEAIRPAKKYKRAIQIPGLVHNIWLRNNWNASTVGDFKQVIKEQKLGAMWGYQLGSGQCNP